jgi:hypothetical protein
MNPPSKKWHGVKLPESLFGGASKEGAMRFVSSGAGSALGHTAFEPNVSTSSMRLSNL